MIRLAIPALCVLAALLLYRRRPLAYMTLALWSWLLTPLVRRLVDYQFGWEEPNFILLTPQLVSMVGGLAMLRPRRRGDTLPTVMVLSIAAVMYGFFVGMMLRPGGEIVYGLVNWLGPLFLGLYVALDWRKFPDYKRWLSVNALWAAALLGAYGVCQYLVAPVWDTYWLEQITGGLIDPSFGLPVPRGIRVWSTLNSPGPFANAMAALLLLLFMVRSKWKPAAAVAGYSALLLSLVRTSWLGWLVGVALLLRRAKAAMVQRVIVSAVLIGLLMIPLLQLPDVAPLLTDRVKTLVQIGSDESFNERAEMYRIVGNVALHEPIGHGLRNQEIVNNRVVDSGLLVMLLSLGWLGLALYAAGIVAFVMRQRRQVADDLSRACEAVCLMFLLQLVGGPVFTSVTGAIFWLCAGFCLSADRWHAEASGLAASRIVIDGRSSMKLAA